jgi:hypothetical protein
MFNIFRRKKEKENQDKKKEEESKNVDNNPNLNNANPESGGENNILINNNNNQGVILPGMEGFQNENQLNDPNNQNQKIENASPDNNTNLNLNQEQPVLNPLNPFVGALKEVPKKDEPPQKVENKIQKEFKHIFQGQDFFSNNTYRKRLIHLTLILTVIVIITLEILCLYLNVCYGETIEMKRFVSSSIAPLLVILLVFLICLYFASDFISRGLIRLLNILIVIILVILLAIGAYAIFLGASIQISNLSDEWSILSYQSRSYYYSNDINVLKKTFSTNMLVTGGLYILISLLGMVIVIFSYQYYFKLTNEWRPPLRARLSDDRAQRYIELYSIYNKEYKRLYELENKHKMDKLPPKKKDEQAEEVKLLEKIDEFSHNIKDENPSYSEIPKKNNYDQSPLINQNEPNNIVIENEEINQLPPQENNEEEGRGGRRKLPPLRRRKKEDN